MISVLATAVVTPFMMADQSAAPVAAVQETPTAYNWANQNAKSIETDEDFNNGMTASQSYIGSPASFQIDDWNLC